jgi:hypothetical protein
MPSLLAYQPSYFGNGAHRDHGWARQRRVLRAAVPPGRSRVVASTKGASDTLDAIQRLYGGATDPDLGGAFDAFFNTARELAQEPDDLSVRSRFVQSAQNIATRVQRARPRDPDGAARASMTPCRTRWTASTSWHEDDGGHERQDRGWGTRRPSGQRLSRRSGPGVREISGLVDVIRDGAGRRLRDGRDPARQRARAGRSGRQTAGHAERSERRPPRRGVRRYQQRRSSI